MAALRFLAAAVCAASLSASLSAGPAIFPLKDVRPGQKAIGRTVFSGSKIEEFQVEILGVLENVGPRKSIILGRLSGGPLAQTGVLQGMSGSPVYIDGKLAGVLLDERLANGINYLRLRSVSSRPDKGLLLRWVSTDVSASWSNSSASAQ